MNLELRPGEPRGGGGSVELEGGWTAWRSGGEGVAMASMEESFLEHWFPWLGRFLKARSLSWPDGRALFRYRCTDEEFRSLPAEIEEKLGSHHPEKGKGALLCLFVAEWWRRSFDGGSWSWKGPLEALGGRAAALTNGLRSDFVEQGIAWWERPRQVNEANARQLFGTLLTEGGLPLRLVAVEARSKVPTFLEKLVEDLAGRDLRELKDIAQDPAKCLERAKDHQAYLPATMRKAEPVLRLGSELAAGIILLDEEVRKRRSTRRRHRAPEMREWLHHLREVEDWQDRLPVDIEADGVWPLVEILLKQSRSTRTREGSKREGRLGWVWRLERTPSGWWKVRSFQAEGIDSGRIAALCGQRTSFRVQVFASSDGSQARLLGDYLSSPKWPVGLRCA
ncbi:MAG: STY4851/ECs_5259 family protein [bacterium]